MKKRLRYVAVFTIPKSIGKGRVLMHNHVQHSVDTVCGENGFRAWTDNHVWPNFKPCDCGWSGLTHYRIKRDGDDS
jgi:hypothetical protein